MAGTPLSHAESLTPFSRRATWFAYSFPVLGTLFAFAMAYFFPMGLRPHTDGYLVELLASVGINLVAAVLIIGPSFFAAMSFVSPWPAIFGCLIGLIVLIGGYLLSSSLVSLNAGVFVPLHAILGAGLIFAFMSTVVEPRD